jgi:RNA polymerase sigma-70 factor (ECF subfamily)
MSLPAARDLHGKPGRAPTRIKTADTATTFASETAVKEAAIDSKPPSADDNGSTDELLLRLISSGDRDALGRLFQRYARLVRGVALRILRDTSEAEDLLQELFLFIHRKSGVFDSSRSSARSWIVQMTYQRAIDRRRYLGSRHFYTNLNLDDSGDILQPQPANNDIAMESLVGTATIERLFDALSEDQRHTLKLYFYEGYTFDEIAAELEQSLRNVRNHYYRGLDKLRKQVHLGKLQSGNGCGKK